MYIYMYIHMYGSINLKYHIWFITTWYRIAMLCSFIIKTALSEITFLAINGCAIIQVFLIPVLTILIVRPLNIETDIKGMME